MRPGLGLEAHDIFLDEDELFSQLCTSASLVKVGSKRGLFLGHTSISKDVVRVWRHWLATQAAYEPQDRSEACAGSEPRNNMILWTDYRTQNVGLLLRVVEHEASHGAPLLIRADEDPPMSYSLQYEKLLIRTSQLLLRLEQSEAQEVTASGEIIMVVTHS